MSILVIVENSPSLEPHDISSEINILNVLDMFEGEDHNPGIEYKLTARRGIVLFPYVAERIAVLITVLGVSKANLESARRRQTLER